MRMSLALFEKQPILKGSRALGVSTLRALSQEGKGGPYERCRHHFHTRIQ
jgi:hypothetical protein